MLFSPLNLKLAESGMSLLQQVRQDCLSFMDGPIDFEASLLIVGIRILKALLDLLQLLRGRVVAKVVPLLEGVLGTGDGVVEGLQLFGNVVFSLGTVMMVVVVVKVFGHAF